MTPYQKTLGKPILRSKYIQSLYNLLWGKKDASEGQERYWTNSLLALGEGDYQESDTGEPPANETFV